MDSEKRMRVHALTQIHREYERKQREALQASYTASHELTDLLAKEMRHKVREGVYAFLLRRDH